MLEFSSSDILQMNVAFGFLLGCYSSLALFGILYLVKFLRFKKVEKGSNKE